MYPFEVDFSNREEIVELFVTGMRQASSGFKPCSCRIFDKHSLSFQVELKIWKITISLFGISIGSGQDRNYSKFYNFYGFHQSFSIMLLSNSTIQR